MKANSIPDILAACLAEVEAGRLTIEQCLEAYAEVAEELRPLLETSAQIPPLREAAIDPTFRLRARANLLASISAGDDGVTNSLLQRLWRQVSGGWAQPPQLVSRRMGMPAIIVFLVMALTTAAGGGAVYASQDALPGDALYEVKTTVEGLQVSLAPGDAAKAEAYLGLAAKRLAEIQKASHSGNAAASNSAAETLNLQLAQVNQHLDGAAASGMSVSGAVAQLKEILERQQQVLAAIEEKAPDKAKSALTKAIVKAAQGLAIAIAKAEDESDSSERGKGRSTPTPTVTTSGQPTSTVGSLVPSRTLTTTPGISSTVSITFTQTVSNVRNLATDPEISGKSYNGLLAKLRAAEAALDRGQKDVAVNILNAFVNELNAFQQAGHISEANYQTLYSSYSALVTSLGSTPKAETTQAKSKASTQSDQDEDKDETEADTQQDRGKSGNNSTKGNSAPNKSPEPTPTTPSADQSKETPRQAPAKGRR